ncbi:MAG: hypothetical protein KBB09_03070 [Firmicutes bacterium]|nr:hypothetical protein [Bacillota bacterium]
MKQQSVIFKGTGRSLKVVVSDEADFSGVLLGIEEKLASNPAFYAGQRITVESRQGLIPDDRSEMIRAVFRRYNIPCSVADAKSAAERAAAMITQTALTDEGPPVRKGAGTTALPSATAAIYRGDVIPGKVVEDEGSVVILGDVLPGGAVKAGGDIVVTGIAGGRLEAGVPDDRTVAIIAGGFAAGTYVIGGREVKVQGERGSGVKMFSLRLAADGPVMDEGDPGRLSRRAQEN